MRRKVEIRERVERPVSRRIERKDGEVAWGRDMERKIKQARNEARTAHHHTHRTAHAALSVVLNVVLLANSPVYAEEEQKKPACPQKQALVHPAHGHGGFQAEDDEERVDECRRRHGVKIGEGGARGKRMEGTYCFLRARRAWGGSDGELLAGHSEFPASISTTVAESKRTSSLTVVEIRLGVRTSDVLRRWVQIDELSGTLVTGGEEKRWSGTEWRKWERQTRSGKKKNQYAFDIDSTSTASLQRTRRCLRPGDAQKGKPSAESKTNEKRKTNERETKGKYLWYVLTTKAVRTAFERLRIKRIPVQGAAASGGKVRFENPFLPEPNLNRTPRSVRRSGWRVEVVGKCVSKVRMSMNIVSCGQGSSLDLRG
ncbi:hypothetical protein C8R45DRAFT_946029 [Mycena sanguinolenta]|nr:hypothetical protein C8R45DRAFT_946029 [Mycena sanguinolenta]